MYLMSLQGSQYFNFRQILYVGNISYRLRNKLFKNWTDRDTKNKTLLTF